MIKVEDTGFGLKVQMKCDTVVDILDELTAVIKTAKNLLAESRDEQTAGELIALCGKLAFAEEKDLERVLEDEIGKLIFKEKGE